MEVAGHAHILSCSPLGVSTPLFDGLWAHIEPKSRPDRALSSTELGDVSSVRMEMRPVACWPRVRRTCGQGRGARAAGPQAERWTHTPRTMSRISAPALRTWAQRWMRQAHALDSP